MTHTVPLSLEETPIVSVTVFNDSAEIRRKIEYDVTEEALKDDSCLVLKLCLKNQCFNDESIRVESTRGKATLFEVQPGGEMTTSTSLIKEYPKAAKLYETLTAKLLERNTLDSEINQLEKSKEAVQTMLTNVVHARAGPLAGLKALDELSPTNLVASFASLSSEVAKQVKTLNSDKLLKKMAMDETQKECEKLRDEIQEICKVWIDVNSTTLVADAVSNLKNELTQIRKQYGRHIKVKFAVHEAGPLSFVLSYSLPSSSWVASYDVKASVDDLSKVSLTYAGIVCQSTTEDWNDVVLNLSTGSPSVAGHPPTLPPQKVSYPAPAPPVPMPCAQPRMMMKSMRMAAAAPEMAVMKAVVNKTGGAHASFSMAGQYSIPSDGHEHRLTITEQVFAKQNYLYCLPEADATVYRAGVMKNSSDFLLLPSDSVSIFWDNAFVAKTSMPMVPPGAEFKTYFGREMQVKVDMKPLRRYRKTAGGMFSGGATDKEMFEHAGFIQNLRNEALQVVVAFRLPESTDETIKVQLDSQHGKVVKVQCETDLEVTQKPDVPTVDANNSQAMVINETTGHVVTLNYIKPMEKMNIVCSYFVERPLNKQILISP